MGAVQFFGRWLGLSPEPVAVGVALGQDKLVVSVLRQDPLRLIGVARCVDLDGVVVDGNVRRPQQAITLLQGMRQALHLPADTDCVVSIDPLHDRLDVRLGHSDRGPDSDQRGGQDPVYCEPIVEVHQSRFDRATFITAAAGFRPRRVDVGPAALARIALVEYEGCAVARSADGWSILTTDDFLDASKRLPSSVRSVQMGTDMGDCGPVPGLTGVCVPTQLADIVDLDTDIEAIGAALALFGLPPLVTASPSSPPLPNSKLRVEPVVPTTNSNRGFEQ